MANRLDHPPHHSGFGLRASLCAVCLVFRQSTRLEDAMDLFKIVIVREGEAPFCWWLNSFDLSCLPRMHADKPMQSRGK